MIRPYRFCHHDPCRGLAREKRAFHIDVEGEVEVALGGVDRRVGRAEPALLTRMSIRPNSATAWRPLR